MKPVIEAILMVADQPLSLERLSRLVPDEGGEKANREVLRDTLTAIQNDYAGRGIELAELASGYRFRTRAEYAEQVSRLWDERKPRYSRAFMETLAIIAYRQPITRGEIEHIRGVAVSTNIMRQLLEREWVRVVGHRDVPGRPSVYATTNNFLDYFGLKTLEELPSLADLKDIDDINTDMFAESMDPAHAAADAAPNSSPDDRVQGDGPTPAANNELQAADGDEQRSHEQVANNEDDVDDEDIDDDGSLHDLESTAELDPIEALAETGDMEEIAAGSSENSADTAGDDAEPRDDSAASG